MGWGILCSETYRYHDIFLQYFYQFYFSVTVLYNSSIIFRYRKCADANNSGRNLNFYIIERVAGKSHSSKMVDSEGVSRAKRNHCNLGHIH